MRIRMLLSVCILLGAGGAFADPDTTPDSNASVVFLRTDCDVNGSPLENCFESMSALSDLSTGWIWNTRVPTASTPLLVVIGPGEFGKFECDGGGYVTLRGSGREQTIIADDDVAVTAKNCENLGFLDLGVRGDRAGVEWIGDGSSTWSDTDIVVTGVGSDTVTLAWGDAVDVNNPTVCGEHYFHGSRVRALGGGTQLTTAFYSQCAQNWFFGGEITAVVDASVSVAADVVHIAGGLGDVRVFGTRIAGSVNGGDVPGALVGVTVINGTFHSHGGVINVSSEGATNEDAVGVRVSGTGHAHIRDTAWVLDADGSGDVIRTESLTGGMVESPFQWETGTTPPAITSLHGQDLFVETDCESSDCTGGSDPHLMIYSTSCTGGGGPWFDVVRQACRVD